MSRLPVSWLRCQELLRDMPCIMPSSRSGKRLLGTQDGLVFLSAVLREVINECLTPPWIIHNHEEIR